MSRNAEESLGDRRNALLVVAALIASATYQAVLQPPTFKLNVDGSSTNGFLASYASWMSGSLGGDIAYILFITGNTFGLFVSVQMIFFLTNDLTFKLPLLLSMGAMVQTYCCYTYYLPFSESLGKEFGLKTVELFSVLPLMISVTLLLIQRRLAQGLYCCLKWLFDYVLDRDMYKLDYDKDVRPSSRSS